MKHQQPEEQQVKSIVNEEAERFTLAAAMMKPEFADQVSESLTTADFTLRRNQLLFSVIADFRAKRFECNRVTIVDALVSRGQLEAVEFSYIIDLDANAPALNDKSLAAYIKILRTKTKLRGIQAAAHDAAKRAESGDEPDEIMRDFESQLYKVAPTSKVVRFGDYIESPANFGRLMNPYSPVYRGSGVFTGFRALDDETGGIFPKEVIVFGAGTGVGKTSIALQIIAYNVKRGVPGVLFSPESNEDEIFNRLACQIARVSVKRFKTGDLNERERAAIELARQEICEWPFYIDSSSRLKGSELRARLLRLVEYHGIKFGVLDYVQKLKSDVRGNEMEKLVDACDTLVEAAKEGAPLVVMAQLSRANRKERRKPIIDDLHGSSAIEKMASKLVIPFRPEMEPGKEGDETLKGVAEFLLLKNRDGERKTIPMRYIGWRTMYEDKDYEAPDLSRQRELEEMF